MEGTTGGTRERGGESDTPRVGDKKKKGGKEKRLGRSLRPHPQPESTTLSVLTRKDLPA